MQQNRGSSRELPRHDYERIPAARDGQAADQHDDEEDLKDGEDVDLPADVYGAVIFSVIHDSVDLMSGHDHDSLAFWINLVRVIFVVTSLVFNYCLQLSLLVWSHAAVVAPAVRNVQQLYKEYHAECFDTDGTFNEAKWEEWDSSKQDELCGTVLSSFWFLYLILCLWWMTMLNEFRKTDRIWRKFHAMPATRDYERQIEWDEDGTQRVKRIVCEIRWFLYIVLILPKHVISVGLLILGTWWLVATDSFGDLILNALALGFVIDIDELIFEAMFPAFMADQIDQVKLWRRRDKDPKAYQRVQWEHIRRSGIYWLVILVGVYVYLSFLQGLPFVGVLPGYAGDAECPGYWRRQTTMICNSWAVWKGAQCFPYGSAGIDNLPPHPEVYG
mmetsp:Transcript_50771/g.127992  ORF Transcript_50771/g.127992 Transcript_50771/m.127992 type:complete len:387 (+) Transcript_50771:83-1243(+)